ncbi:MAG: PNGase F N-terminal domain-containing protein [Mangrovibacterium sp.]
MCKTIVLAALLLWCYAAPAKPTEFTTSGRVEYATLRNGKVMEKGGKLLLHYAGDLARLQADQSNKDLIPEVPRQYDFIDYGQAKVFRQATFMDGASYFSTTDVQPLEGFKAEGSAEEILGYTCQKYTGSSFSNKIELWVTTEAGIQGSPMTGFVWPGGLVLKYQRNDNAGWQATAVTLDKKNKTPLSLMPASMGTEISQLEFSQRLANAFVKTIPVFTRQQISWGATINNPKGEYTDSVYRFAGGTIALKRVKLPPAPDGSTVFAELTEQSNGDAYDRTGSVFLVPTGKARSFLEGLKNGVGSLPHLTGKDGKVYQGIVKTADYDPLIELMRFFTPFGVRHFNDKRNVGIAWDDSVSYKTDLSDLLPLLRGEVWIGVFVGNYDKGGHTVSLNLKYYLNEQEKPQSPDKKFWAEPVFNTTNVMEMAGQEYGTLFGTDTLTVEFEVPEGIKTVNFRYITTGHGGWGGGDEFVPKKNELFIDGTPFFTFTPWRVDCGTYRASNPASGNFWNGLSSSDYSRSGWCPGTVSYPYFTSISGLAPGKHRIHVFIPQGERDGGSFSAWNISGLFYGEYQE